MVQSVFLIVSCKLLFYRDQIYCGVFMIVYSDVSKVLNPYDIFEILLSRLLFGERRGLSLKKKILTLLRLGGGGKVT